MTIELKDDSDDWQNMIESLKPEDYSKLSIRPWRPWWLDPLTPQDFPEQFSGPKPTIEGYPPWVTPGLPPMHPSRVPDRINSALSSPRPASSITGYGNADGLLGILYEMMQQGAPKSDDGPSSNSQDASASVLPERRLGKRIYRL